MRWLTNHIQIESPKKPKKITGTRLASILGMDKWNTPFKTWCAITKTYEDPFIDNKFTLAGKAIEPNIINYLNKVYYFGDLKSPTDIYGQDYFKKTWGDFFKDTNIFGGMWDALVYDDGKPSTVIEIKTTKRAEDWSCGAPDYYALQASLYAHLLHIDDVVMVAAFLEESDYDHPELFVPSSDNTITDSFKVSERFPNFEELIEEATAWWELRVEGGLSPEFDETKDKDILKVLRINNVNPESDVDTLLTEAELLKDEIESVKAPLAEKEKRLESITFQIKEIMISQFRDGDKSVALTGHKYNWVVSKSNTTTVDKDALKKDGQLEKYSKSSESYRISVKNKEA